MRLLVFSDWLLGSKPLPPGFGQRIHSLVVDLRPNALWFLGNTIDDRVGVQAAFVDHDVLDTFGQNGWISRLRFTYPIHFMPTGHDRFLLDPEWSTTVQRYLPDVTLHDMPVLLMPEGRPTRIVVMDGWQPRFWPNEKVTLRQRLAGAKPLAGRARTLIAYDAIRREAQEIAEDGKKHIQNHPEAWGVVHGGDFPYWGCYGGDETTPAFYAGCPGGREWVVLVDLDCRELSGLVRV